MTPEPHELQALVRQLHQQASPWLPAGSGSRLGWGPPVQAGGAGAAAASPAPLVLSTARLDRILEHSPGDFTVSVEAGTPLVVLQQELQRHRQWLALDWPAGSGPAGAASGSVGGLVARGLAGGYRQRYLGVRDQLIGIGLLRADGTAARAGGKVVKNVAGYDLMRLLCGSWGSLALITTVTLRTLPLPPERRGLLLQAPLPALAALNRWLLDSSLSPERIDWQRRAGGDHRLLVALASITRQTLDEQLDCIRNRAGEQGIAALALDAEELEAAIAGAGPATPQPDWLLRIGVPAAQLESLLADADGSLRGLDLELGGGSGLGMGWADASALPSYRVEALRRRCRQLGGHLTVLRQPAGSGLPAWLDAPSRPLIEAIKRQFDPLQQLARGRLPGVQA